MKKIILILNLLCGITILAQSNLSAEFVGFTIHPAGDPTAHLQPNKLDQNARFVMNYGGVLTYEKYLVSDIFAVRVLEAVFADCSAGWASITQVAIKGVVLRTPKHRLGVSLGPGFMVRESWTRFEDYKSSGFLNEGNSKLLGPVQYKFFPVACELEYEYSLTNRCDLAFSITPALPMAMTIGAGFKFWFNKDFNEGGLFLPRVK
jgi:hypothetical protein